MITWKPILIGLGVALVTDLLFGLAEGEGAWSGLRSGLPWAFLAGLVGTWLMEILYFDPKRWKKFENGVLDFERRVLDRIAKSAYTGFFTLLTGIKGDLKDSLQTLDAALERLLFGDAHSRSVILDFLIDCLSRMAENGFVARDATVGDYVKYISKSVVIPEARVFATCVVRPFWFVTDSMSISAGKQIVLEPKIDGDVKYGKGEHLKHFQADQNGRFRRLLVLSDELIAEMLLTACIDEGRNFDDVIPRNPITGIPEIDWFSIDVNQEKNVNLYYVYKNHENLKAILEALGDRVLVSSPLSDTEFNLSVQFEFTNLETGTMVLSWGKQIKPECLSLEPSTKLGYTRGIYQDFASFLANSEFARDGMKRHLEKLNDLTKIFFVQHISNIDQADTKQILQEHEGIIFEAFRKLLELLNSSQRIHDIYQNLLQHYQRQQSFPKKAVIVTLDNRYSQYPVRTADWKGHWDHISQ